MEKSDRGSSHFRHGLDPRLFPLVGKNVKCFSITNSQELPDWFHFATIGLELPDVQYDGPEGSQFSCDFIQFSCEFSQFSCEFSQFSCEFFTV